MTTTSTWRYACPNGHVNVQRRVRDGFNGPKEGSLFYCDTCKNYHDSPHHEYLIDKKTGNRVYR